jgi:hypothetical protein
MTWLKRLVDQSDSGLAYRVGMDTDIPESQFLTRAAELRCMAETATTTEAVETILRVAEWYEDTGLRRRDLPTVAVSVSIPRPGAVHWRWRPLAAHPAQASSSHDLAPGNCEIIVAAVATGDAKLETEGKADKVNVNGKVQNAIQGRDEGRPGLLTRAFSLLTLTPLLAVMLAAPVMAQHQDRGHGYSQSRQWHGGDWSGGSGHRDNSGAVVGGVLLGLGVGALLGGALVAPPPVVYPPPPPYANPYAPPPPVYYGY